MYRSNNSLVNIYYLNVLFHVQIYDRYHVILIASRKIDHFSAKKQNLKQCNTCKKVLKISLRTILEKIKQSICIIFLCYLC